MVLLELFSHPDPSLSLLPLGNPMQKQQHGVFIVIFLSSFRPCLSVHFPKPYSLYNFITPHSPTQVCEQLNFKLVQSLQALTNFKFQFEMSDYDLYGCVSLSESKISTSDGMYHCFKHLTLVSDDRA